MRCTDAHVHIYGSLRTCLSDMVACHFSREGERATRATRDEVIKLEPTPGFRMNNPSQEEPKVPCGFISGAESTNCFKETLACQYGACSRPIPRQIPAQRESR